MSYMAAVQSEVNMLKDGNTILVNRYLAAAIGESCAVVLGALISKFRYYTEYEKDIDGWFYCTIDDLFRSTGKKYDSQTTAVKKLVDLGLIEYKVAGIPAKRYFRVVLKGIETLINKGKELLGEVKEKIKNTIDNLSASIDKEETAENLPVKDETIARNFSKKQLAIMVRKIKNEYPRFDDQQIEAFILRCYNKMCEYKKVRNKYAYMLSLISKEQPEKESFSTDYEYDSSTLMDKALARLMSDGENLRKRKEQNLKE